MSPDPGVAEFLLLRRACRNVPSYVAELAGAFYDGGIPILARLSACAPALIESGKITLGQPEPDSCGLRRVVISAAGWAHYEQMCMDRGTLPYPGAGGAP